MSLLPLWLLALLSSSTFCCLCVLLRLQELSSVRPSQRRSLRVTPKVIFRSLSCLLRFRPIFSNGSRHHTAILQLLHTPTPPVLRIPQTEVTIFPLTLLPSPSQRMALCLSSHPRQKILSSMKRQSQPHWLLWSHMTLLNMTAIYSSELVLHLPSPHRWEITGKQEQN